MKKVYFFLFMVLNMSGEVFSQVAINTDGTPPNPSAGLDVNFNNKGLLPPRMTHAVLNSISTPADGLMVYCTDCGSNGLGALSIFTGGTWFIMNVNCLNPPSPPIAGTHVPSQTQIVWNWNPTSGATGYKWNITNNYATATELGTSTTKTETGLTPNTTYTRYVWAYSSCGSSAATPLTQLLPFLIGQSYGGGIIFYIDGTGQHGLIAADCDQSTSAEWGCIGTSIPGTSTAIGTGQANTTAIITGCSTTGTAAQICNDLVLNGYNDWFLPSKDELNQMYQQKNLIGGFVNFLYWSSSEYSANYAWNQFLYNGLQYDYCKSSTYYVRAIRTF
jgi:hypothetical protein